MTRLPSEQRDLHSAYPQFRDVRVCLEAPDGCRDYPALGLRAPLRAVSSLPKAFTPGMTPL